MPYETPTCWVNFLMDFFGLWSMRSEISNTFFSVSIDGLPVLVASHTAALHYDVAPWSSEIVPGIVVEHLVYILHHTKTHVPLGMYAQQITPLYHTSFLPHYLAQSDCLAADRKGQGDTRLTLTPSVIPNSNYVIMVSDRNCLKYCIFTCFLYCNHQVHRDFLITCTITTE